MNRPIWIRKVLESHKYSYKVRPYKVANMATHLQFSGCFYPLQATIISYQGKGCFLVDGPEKRLVRHFFAPDHVNPILGYLKNRLCQGGRQDWEESWEELKLGPAAASPSLGAKVCFLWEDGYWRIGQFSKWQEEYPAVKYQGQYFTNPEKIVPYVAKPPSVLECLGKTVLVKRGDQDDDEIEAIAFKEHTTCLSHVIAILP